MNTTIRQASALTLLALLASIQVAHAGSLFQDQDVDPSFRAKIMKEKAKANQQQALVYGTTSSSTTSSAQCGAQSIGNVNTGGTIGTTPKEVFVFAPNAINLVSSNGCK